MLVKNFFNKINLFHKTASELHEIRYITHIPGKKDNITENVEIISQLPGFLDIEAYNLFYLLGKINVSYKNILEIGVFCGRSLAALGCIFPAARIIGVDPFYENFRKSPAYKDEANYLSNASNKQKPEERINNLWKIISLLDKRISRLFSLNSSRSLQIL